MRDASRVRLWMPALVVGLLALSGVAFASTGGPTATASGSSSLLSITPLRTSQQALLKTRKLKARVHSRVAGFAVVVPGILSEDGSKATIIGKPRKTRFSKPGTLRLSLRLT